MSYTQICYHIVFATKNRENVLDELHRNELYRYIWGIFNNRKCHLFRIGGTSDHVHIFTNIHPTVCLADLVREVKTSSSKWMKESDIFPAFKGWQNEYAAFTKSFTHKRTVIEYIKNQNEHHKHESFVDEFKRLLVKEGVYFDEKYLI